MKKEIHYKGSKNKVTKVQFTNREFTKAQYEVLYLVSLDLTIIQITNSRKTSLKATYKLINKLLKKGLIRKIGKIYETTREGQFRVQKFLPVSPKVQFPIKSPLKPNDIRANNIKFYVKVLYPKDFHLNTPRILIKRKFNYKKVQLRNNEQYVFNYQDIRITATTKGFIFSMPNLFSNIPIEAFSVALELLFSIIPYIESSFGVLLLKDKYMNIKIISQEYALIKNQLAQDPRYKVEKEKLRVFDDHGILRLVIDYSFHLDEFEAVSKEYSLDDATIVQDFFKDLLKNPFKPSDIRETFLQLNQSLSNYDRNIELHIKVQRETLKTLREIRKEIKNRKIYK